MSSAWNVQNVESEQDMNSKQIDQLRARIAELEAAHAAAVLSNVQLRVAIDRVRSGAAALGLDRIFDIATEALALPSDTSALDAYVAEKVKEQKEAADFNFEQYQDLGAELDKVCRQRDLAIKALESIAGRRMFIDSLASNVDIAVMTLDVIKESEEN